LGQEAILPARPTMMTPCPSTRRRQRRQRMQRAIEAIGKDRMTFLEQEL